MEQNRRELEEYIRATGEYLKESGDEGEAGSESWIGRSQRKLRDKWASCNELLQTREAAAVAALENAERYGMIQYCRCCYCCCSSR